MRFLSLRWLLVLCPVLAYAATNRDFPTAPITASFDNWVLEDGKDLIFPSLIHADEYFEDPIAKYYLYTSPHGGADIRLYTANSLDGPWNRYKTVVNAALARAEHTSSPHAVWNKEAEALFLNVHAPNAQTVYLHSKNGVDFEFGGVCVTREMITEVLPFTSRSGSYARIYRHRIPEYENTWTMTVTASGRNEDKTLNYNAVVLCTSDDGIHWTARRPLINDGNQGIDYKAMDGCWLPLAGENYLVYTLRSNTEEKGSREEPIRLHIAHADKNWRNWRHLGIFYEPQAGFPDFKAARGFSWSLVDGEPVFLYEAGQNRTARLARLKLDKKP